MTEAEWRTESDDPYAMVNFLRDRVSRRKAKLFACACYRRPRKPLADWEVVVVEVGERAADGVATADEIKNAEQRAVGASGVAWAILARDWWTAVEASRAAGEWEYETYQADLVRDIFGNPFRPVSVDRSWLTSTVVKLAEGMYESRDFSPMPILADALQDAGCDHADVLTHCRSATPHVRGCWVVDLVLGKA